MPALYALVALVSLSTVPAVLAAQAASPSPHAAQPQRPSVATHSGTVAPGWLELEFGLESDRYADGSRGGIAPLLAKLGLARRLQLELQAPIVNPPGDGAAGIGDVSMGLKWRLIDGGSIVGNFAILPAIKLATGSAASGRGTGTRDASLLLISSHKLRQVALDLNVGFTRRGGDGTVAPRSASLWAAALGGPVAAGFGWVAEVYGYPATSGPAGAASIVAVLVGPTLQARESLVLDVGMINRISGPQPRALYAGATCNVGRLW